LLSVPGVGDVVPPVEIETPLLDALARRQEDCTAEEMRRYVNTACEEIPAHFEKRRAAKRRSVA
jgi:hypothetical protein